MGQGRGEHRGARVGRWWGRAAWLLWGWAAAAGVLFAVAAAWLWANSYGPVRRVEWARSTDSGTSLHLVILYRGYMFVDAGFGPPLPLRYEYNAQPILRLLTGEWFFKPRTFGELSRHWLRSTADPGVFVDPDWVVYQQRFGMEHRLTYVHLGMPMLLGLATAAAYAASAAWRGRTSWFPLTRSLLRGGARGPEWVATALALVVPAFAMISWLVTASASLRGVELWLTTGDLVVQGRSYVFEQNPVWREWFPSGLWDAIDGRALIRSAEPIPSQWTFKQVIRDVALATSDQGTTTWVIPLWLPLLALIGVRAGIGVWRWTARERPRGVCVACGYDLRASPDRCPECGRFTRLRPPRRWAKTASVCASCLVVGVVLVCVVAWAGLVAADATIHIAIGNEEDLGVGRSLAWTTTSPPWARSNLRFDFPAAWVVAPVTLGSLAWAWLVRSRRWHLVAARDVDAAPASSDDNAAAPSAEWVR